MGKIIVCIDGSQYADKICDLSGWVSRNIKSEIALLHVVAPHYDFSAKSNLSGAIGLGAKSGLLKELTEIDEKRGRLEQQKGQLILSHASEYLANSHNISNIEILHRRGALNEVVFDLESQAELVIMGKKGESNTGLNLESIARNLSKPLLIVNKAAILPQQRFLIAYDGSKSAQKALDFVISSPLLQGLECHLLKICESSGKAEEILQDGQRQLSEAGFKVKTALRKGKVISNVIADYSKEFNIELLVMGAYGHSKIRNIILGSTTEAMIKKLDLPLLLIK